MIAQWIINEPEDGPYERCILGLPGRGNSAEMMARIIRDFQLPRTLIVAVRPWQSAWYPQPFSADDQEDATEGIPLAIRAINGVVRTLINGFNLSYEKIALLGYSAGGVMGIQTTIRRMLSVSKGKDKTKPCFAGTVVYCGAILEPEKIPGVPNVAHRTPFLLVHNRDDKCFDWHERYLPMKSALVNGGYDVVTAEHLFGGHMISTPDIFSSSRFLGRCFGIDDWVHPYETTWLKQQEEMDDEKEPLEKEGCSLS